MGAKDRLRQKCKIHPIPITFISFLLFLLFLTLMVGTAQGVPLLQESNCRWGKADLLLIADSTENVGAENHRAMMEFFENLLKRIGRSQDGILVAMAQFTPEARMEFSLESVDARLAARINQVPYSPCRGDVCRSRATSLNTLALMGLATESGNRIAVADVVVVVATSLYRIPELNANELLMKPISATHAFLITVGNSAPSGAENRLQFAATTSNLAAIDFRALPELVGPLCQSVASFLRESPVSSAGIPTPTFILIICLIAVFALAILLLLACGVYHYRSQTNKLRYQLARERDNFRKTDEYYRSKLRERSAQKKEHEKTMLELINESNKVRDHYREQNHQQLAELREQTMRADLAEQRHLNERTRREIEQEHAQLHHRPEQQNQNPNYHPNPNGPPLLPIIGVPLGLSEQQLGQLSPLVRNPGEISRRDKGDDHPRRRGSDDHPRRRGSDEDTRHRGHRDRDRKPNGGGGGVTMPPSESDFEEDTLAGTSDSKEFAFERTTSHLPADHPARNLPPVDVLLLVDASSSIGNGQFEQVKQFLSDFVNDIDIAPGRSRICVTLFAQEPQVFFGFDRFYSNTAVQKALQKVPYLGGPTYLAKALSFAAGVLYQEQNMKTARFRKHKFMPTPRHDRLQVMVVVSDGASDDNFDKQATHLHEKMLVKIAAVVTKSFNKDRLLPITRFDGSVFLLDQQQALSIWLWRQQRMWTENFAGFVEREKSLTNLIESARPAGGSSPRKKKKKQQGKSESTR